MEGDEASKRPDPHLDHGHLEYSRTASISREAHCYGDYKRWAFSKSKTSQSSLPQSIRVIQWQIEFVTSSHEWSARSLSEKDQRVQSCPRSQQVCAEASRRSETIASRQTRATINDASNSPFSKGIWGFKFFKKFMILTFDCYSDQCDPAQHLS